MSTIIEGCMNPAAVNFNNTANRENYSCIYLEKLNGVCYAFEDVPPEEVQDESFTMSWALLKRNWVYFHDYIPDFYFSTRHDLFSIKDGKVFRHNKGIPGRYDTAIVKPWFIDMVWPNEEAFTLNTIKWITEILDQAEKESHTKTFSHITVWNSHQTTGRLSLNDVFNTLDTERYRRTKAEWSFNDLRDMLTNHTEPFLESIFKDFRTLNTSATKPWDERELLEDNYIIIRFELDNALGETLHFHGAEITANLSTR